MQCIIMENTPTKLRLHDETKKRAHDSQIVRAKANPKPSHGGPSHRQAPGTNPQIKAPRQSRHRARGSTHRRATKEETTATNRDWAQNQAHRPPHDTQTISNPYITQNNMSPTLWARGDKIIYLIPHYEADFLWLNIPKPMSLTLITDFNLLLCLFLILRWCKGSFF